MDGWEGLAQQPYFLVYILHLATSLLTQTPTTPHPPSKGNDLAETLFVQRHSAVRAWSQAKMGCYDKGLCVEKSKNGAFS